MLNRGLFGSSLEPIKAGDKVGVVVIHGEGGTTRWSVVSALEEIGDPAALGPIQALRNDPDEDVRDAVADAVARLQQ